MTERLEEEATSLAAHLAAATCRWLGLIAELDRREAWVSWGCRSMAHWLSWRCGIDARTAREHLRVGRALADLPRLRAVFEAGELSYSLVRAATRVADDGTEEALVALARHSTASQLERAVRATIVAARADTMPAAGAAGEGWVGPELHTSVGEDGRWELRVSGLAAEEGAVVEAALRLLVDRRRAEQAGAWVGAWIEARAGGSAGPAPAGVPVEGGSAGPSSGWSVPAGVPVEGGSAGSSSGWSVPAGVPVEGGSAGSSSGWSVPAGVPVEGGSAGPSSGWSVPAGVPVEGGSAGSSSGWSVPAGVPVEGGSAGPFAARRAAALVEMAELALASPAAGGPVSSGDRFQVVVVADEAGCHLDHGPGLADATARRLACDASVVLLRTHDGQPLDIGRKTRSIPPAVRRVLDRRDGGCRFPGCGRRAFTQAHHVVHWVNDGPTSLDNLVLVCTFHHRLLHEGGWTVSGHPGIDLRFHRPDGTTLAAAPARQAVGPGLVERHRQAGLAITPSTAVSRWAGDRLDLAATVDAIHPRHRSG
ncbi:MAG: DUF222 domain-containing protein [Acidimicrobiia bacterium]